MSDDDLYPSRVADKPVWLERRDPVLHRPWSSEAPLSQAQCESFERDGFLVLENLFEPEEVQALQGEMNRLRAAPASLDADTLIAEPQSGILRSIFAVHRQSPLLARLCSDERLVAAAQHILGDDVYIHQSRLNYKSGFDGTEFYWHSDFETWHIEDGMPRMRAISMSVLLAENTPNNGPLMLMPGSHKTYVACVGETPDDHYKQSLRKQEYGVPDPDSLTKLAEAGGIVAPIGPPGTVVIFDCNTMHGSNGNITPFPRANAFFVYNARANALRAPYGGVKPRPEFIATRETLEVLEPVRGSLAEQERAA